VAGHAPSSVSFTAKHTHVCEHTLVRLKEWRDRRYLTQGELAERAKVSRATISLLESGSRGPQYPIAKRLAEALGVTLDDLYGVDQSGGG
jgi:transcriptional regulator with XRE-family HTH domain